jgi:hypothetical protein
VRISYVFALDATLAASPALAQVIVTTPGNDAAAHQYQAKQDRAAGWQDMRAARENGAMGNYAAAAQDQAAARESWHARIIRSMRPSATAEDQLRSSLGSSADCRVAAHYAHFLGLGFGRGSNMRLYPHGLLLRLALAYRAALYL